MRCASEPKTPAVQAMGNKTARLTLLLDPRKKALLEEICAAQDLTPSQVVRRLIREYIIENAGDRPLPRWLVSPARRPPRRLTHGRRSVAADRLRPRRHCVLARPRRHWDPARTIFSWWRACCFARRARKPRARRGCGGGDRRRPADCRATDRSAGASIPPAPRSPRRLLPVPARRCRRRRLDLRRRLLPPGRGTAAAPGASSARAMRAAARGANVLPVDVAVPGCPPAPVDILRGILTAISGR